MSQSSSPADGLSRKLDYQEADWQIEGPPPKPAAAARAGAEPEAEADPESGHAAVVPASGATLESPVAQDRVGLSSAFLVPSSSPAGRVYWETFFVVFPVFCGYAALFGLQHEVKAKLGIQDNSSAASHSFGTATSFLYIFNLIMRFAHNVVFGCVGPRGRVFISMFAMSCSMLILTVPIMTLGYKSLMWVVLAYSLGGISIGCFESNLLACLTPLGHQTKRIAICGIPIGVSTTCVGGFLLMGPPFHVPVRAVYLAVAAGVLCGMAVMRLRIPSNTTPRCAGQGWLRKQLSDARQWRLWLPGFWHYPLAMTLNMFSLSAFSPGVALFIYNRPQVTLAGGAAIQTASFFAIFNLCMAVGGLSGRWVSYYLRPRHPISYIVINAAGVALVLSRVPLVVPLGGFCVSLGDGLIYGAMSRHVDTAVPKQFNLIAISFWLFVGDIGSVTGSNMMSFIRDWVVGH